MVSTGLATINIVLLLLVFRFKPLESKFSYRSTFQNNTIFSPKLLALLADAGQAPDEQSTTSRENKFKQIVGIRAVHFLAIFALIYIGLARLSSFGFGEPAK